MANLKMSTLRDFSKLQVGSATLVKNRPILMRPVAFYHATPYIKFDRSTINRSVFHQLRRPYTNDTTCIKIDRSGFSLTSPTPLQRSFQQTSFRKVIHSLPTTAIFMGLLKDVGQNELCRSTRECIFLSVRDLFNFICEPCIQFILLMDDLRCDCQLFKFNHLTQITPIYPIYPIYPISSQRGEKFTY